MTTITKATARNGEEVTVITYHKTHIVKFGARYIVLDTGGYFTATTKTRMNQASNQFGLGYSIFQKKGAWYCSFEGMTQKFIGKRLVLERRYESFAGFTASISANDSDFLPLELN